MEKRRNSSFPHYFIYIFLTSGVKLHIHLLNVIVQLVVFLTLSTPICRGTDISKYFSESLEIRDNESRLYVCHFFLLFYSFIFYFLIQCLANLWVNFSSVVVSEIRNPDLIIYRLATELNKPKNLYVYF